ncbi:MAG: SIS domain-containing protein [Dehalococcoidia bacterium]|nr:SIS domain-containing protein [Dehalococcoidia bacterium]
MSPIDEYLDQVRRTLDLLPRNKVEEVIEMLLRAYAEDRQVFTIGNGGSSSTASHFACDLAKSTVRAGRKRFRAIALTDNVALLTAWANDSGYENVFAEQLANLMSLGDVLVAISGSGNSPNILEAVKKARARGGATIGFTGFGGGELREMVDLCVVVPSQCMAQVEDVHLILEHLISSCIGEVISNEGGIFGSGRCDQREPSRSCEDLGGIPVSAASR